MNEIKRRCGCRRPDGRQYRLLNVDAPTPDQIAAACPLLVGDQSHGSFGYCLSVPPSRTPDTRRVQIRKFGFLTRSAAEIALNETRSMLGLPFDGSRAPRVQVPCEYCGAPTYDRHVIVDPGSLFRRVGHVCDHCYVGSAAYAVSQNAARERRTRHDWRFTQSVTQRASLGVDPPHDQYESASRAVIREFWDSHAEMSQVFGIDINALQASVRTLGLSAELDVEQRDSVCVLRRRA